MRFHFASLFFAVALACLTGCEPSYTEADGAPGGKNSMFPPDSEQRNMSQTGTSDVQIDPQTRADFDRQH